jgi:multiple sugar transport system permease protein
MPRSIAATLRDVSFYAAIAFFVVLTAFPFYWMVITSFKSNPDLYNVTSVPFWFNEAPTLEHFRYLFEQTQFVRWLLNSFVIGTCVVAITLLAALPAGYSLARLTGRGGEALGIGIFLTYLVPPTLLFLPLSRIVANLGLQNSMWSLVLVYPTFTIPFCTWLLMGFFKAMPVEIEEAAIVDGCSRFGAFLKNGCSAVAAGHLDHRHLHLHADDARICLRTHLHILDSAKAGNTRCGNRSHQR